MNSNQALSAKKKDNKCYCCDLEPGLCFVTRPECRKGCAPGCHMTDDGP
jgi:hypothetical protein